MSPSWLWSAHIQHRRQNHRGDYRLSIINYRVIVHDTDLIKTLAIYSTYPSSLSRGLNLIYHTYRKLPEVGKKERKKLKLRKCPTLSLLLKIEYEAKKPANKGSRLTPPRTISNHHTFGNAPNHTLTTLSSALILVGPTEPNRTGKTSYA